MDYDAVRISLPRIVRPYLPRGVSKYEFRFVESIPDYSAVGIRLDPPPFCGRVIAVTQDAIVVKTDRNRFDVIDRSVATLVPDVGDRVEVTPYGRHHFDGSRVGSITDADGTQPDGLSGLSRLIIFGGSITHFPVVAKRSSYLSELIRQLEHLPAPDGFRTLAHLLVDAKATNFTVVDPEDNDAHAISPALHFSVTTEKFEGDVHLIYDYQKDYYVIELRKSSVIVDRVADICFDQIGDVLDEKIDDGRWRLIHINVQEKAYCATIRG